ncbi:MAG: TATA-box-binding protein [Euryarchaeota archaeon]
MAESEKVEGPEKVEPEVEIQNIVASVDLKGEVNLDECSVILQGEYEPEQFPGLVYRLEDIGTVVLIFRSGKMVCTGAKTREQIYESVERVREDLSKKCGVEFEGEPEVEVQNIVASIDFNVPLDLDMIAEVLTEDEDVVGIEYEPEQFPGLVLRLKEPKVAMLLFYSGKAVCTGAKTEDEPEKAARKVAEKIEKYGLRLTG